MAERSLTPRGFTVYDRLTDSYGHEVRVQQSSSASGDRVWIFCMANPGEPENPSPHLNVRMAVRVRDALDAFIREHQEEGSGLAPECREAKAAAGKFACMGTAGCSCDASPEEVQP